VQMCRTLPERYDWPGSRREVQVLTY